MQQKTQHRIEPWAGERAPRPGSDTFFAPPKSAKSGHALESPASKLGSILLLLAISSVAAVGVLLPEEDDPLTSPANAPKTATQITTRSASNGAPHKMPLAPSDKLIVPKSVIAPRNTSQQAYALAYALAKQRVTTVAGLTRQQRTQIAHEALARVLSGDVSPFDSAAPAVLAKRAPEAMKDAALLGVRDGEATGISAQSQLLVERMLSRESRSTHE